MPITSGIIITPASLRSELITFSPESVIIISGIRNDGFGPIAGLNDGNRPVGPSAEVDGHLRVRVADGRGELLPARLIEFALERGQATTKRVSIAHQQSLAKALDGGFPGRSFRSQGKLKPMIRD